MTISRVFTKSHSAIVRRDSTMTITTLDSTRPTESGKNTRSYVAQSGNLFHAKFQRSQENFDFVWLFFLRSQIFPAYMAIYTRISTLNWVIICKNQGGDVPHCREKSKKAIRNFQVEIFTTSCVRGDRAEIERVSSSLDCKKWRIHRDLNSNS